ncbi:hypothetical protein C0989_008571 [Termitomyces sp. Mn162]|nr:hypothetical protein C0989_008571 [Termitomyces sp. Mn162]
MISEDGKSTSSNDATQPSVPFARRLRGGAASDNGGGSDVEDEEDNDEDNEDNDDGVVYDSDDIGPTLRRLKDEILALRSNFDVTAQRFGEPRRRKALVQWTFPFKVPQGREVQTEQHNDTMRVVWKEMRSLLGTKKDREFPNIVSERPELLAAPRDVFNFCFDDDAPGPNLQHPQIYIEAPENIWNVSLARQFADMVMQKYPEKDLSTDIVARHFLNRLDTLWKACAKACPRANEQPEDVLVRMTAEFQAMSHRKRVRMRQKQLYLARSGHCQDQVEYDNNPAWNEMLLMVRFLGVDGQSSDESDGGEYRVKIQTWRDPHVTRLLRYIDRSHPTTNILGNRLPGSAPRIRQISEREETTRLYSDIPAKLPANFYDKVWFETLVPGLQTKLDPHPVLNLPHLQN